MNRLAVRYNFIAFFFKIITYTSSASIYIFYAILIPIITQKGIAVTKVGIIGFLFQVPIYLLSKNLIKRSRPKNIHSIKQLIKAPDKYSFPSGHSASSMLFILIINHFFSSVILFFAIWAILIFLSRIALGLHYFSDVLGGIVLGILSYLFAINIITCF